MDKSIINCVEVQIFYSEVENKILPDVLHTIEYFCPRKGIKYQMNEFDVDDRISRLPYTGKITCEDIPKNTE